MAAWNNCSFLIRFAFATVQMLNYLIKWLNIYLSIFIIYSGSEPLKKLFLNILIIYHLSSFLKQG